MAWPISIWLSALSAACSPLRSAKVPFAIALWLAVLRRPVHGSVSWQATTHQHPAVMAKGHHCLALASSAASLASSRPQVLVNRPAFRRSASIRRWPASRASGRIAVNPREFWHAKVKHLSAKQGLLVLTGCFFSPQPNVAVKPTPTSFTCGFPARFALRCGLPVALGFSL